ncbi:MAG TPA: phosphatase PAP2 family protein [Gemmatimonadaceae bacterium]
MADQTSAPLPNVRLVACVAIVSTALFVALTTLVVARQTDVLDRNLILWLRASASPWLTTALLAVTFTSGRLAIPAFIVFALALYRRSGVHAAGYYAGACATAQALNAIMKHAVGRVRPHNVSPRLTAAGGFGYPSADAMLAVVIFGLGTLMLCWTIRSRATRVVALGVVAIFILLASVARVYLGAHWPTDVLGGALAGIACAAVWSAAFMRGMPARVEPRPPRAPG